MSLQELIYIGKRDLLRGEVVCLGRDEEENRRTAYYVSSMNLPTRPLWTFSEPFGEGRRDKTRSSFH